VSAGPLPLAAAAERLRGKPGRPRLTEDERAKRGQFRAAVRAAQLAAVKPRLFTVDAAALYVSLSVWTIRALVANGTLPRVLVPSGAGELRKVLLDREDLDRLIAAWKQ